MPSNMIAPLPWKQSLAYLLLPVLLSYGFQKARGGNVNPRKEIYLPDYTVYHNLSSVQKHMLDIVNHNPSYIKLDWTYKSRHNRPQLFMRITNFTDNNSSSAHHGISVPKVKILLSYGEHAREFLPVESLFHLLLNITEGLSAPKGSPAALFSGTILSRLDLFVIGMVNPDGRQYVENTGNYCWRGTSTGVDLNRNFDWQFGDKGSSADKNDEEYRGTRAFSEPETSILKDLTAKYHFDAFVSFHSGIKQIYVPYADSLSKKIQRKPTNIEDMLELASKMSAATVHQYTYGLAYQLNEYTADGTIFDYMAGIRRIPFSFAIELWGVGDHKESKCFDLFNPKSRDLPQALQDIHPLYVALFSYLITWKEKQIRKLFDPEVDAPSLTFGYCLLIAVILLTFLVAIHNKLPPCLRLYPRRRIISLRSLSSTFSVFMFRT